MIAIRRADERGRTDWGWLDSRHTFSFGEYFDERQQGFRALRVLNDDRVEGGAGFGAHSHRDMEIFSFVLEGALKHQDSAGGGGIIRPGEIQFMRAGTGVTHSEQNASSVEPVHFLQIWVVPDTRGLPPRLRPEAVRRAGGAEERFVLLASRDGRDGSIQVQQDLDDLRSRAWAPGRRGRIALRPGPPRVGARRARAAWS